MLAVAPGCWGGQPARSDGQTIAYQETAFGLTSCHAKTREVMDGAILKQTVVDA